MKAKIFMVLTAIFTMAMSVVAYAAPPTNQFTQLFTDLDLTGPLQSIVNGVSGQVTDLIPIGIGIVLVIAIPRVISRVVRAFI
jgi:hypothetical protein